MKRADSYEQVLRALVAEADHRPRGGVRGKEPAALDARTGVFLRRPVPGPARGGALARSRPLP